MEIVRYMTLAGLLFSIGVYGALTRRSFAGVLLSLSISAGAIALAFVTFNHLIQPSETEGYLFGLSALLLSVMYGVFAAQFIRREEPKEPVSAQEKISATAERPTAVSGETPLVSNTLPQSSMSRSRVRFSRRSGEGFVGVVSFTDSFAFQVTVMMIFVVGYVLMRLSPLAALAFVAGVGALTHILHRRKSAEHLYQKPAPGAQPIIDTRD